ncbi:hypothetical protein GCM10027566_21460 [Arachidicoccus ginsenosidivorans]
MSAFRLNEILGCSKSLTGLERSSTKIDPSLILTSDLLLAIETTPIAIRINKKPQTSMEIKTATNNFKNLTI